MHRIVLVSWILLTTPALNSRCDAASPAVRREISLNGTWLFSRSGDDTARRVVVPNPFEAHEGHDFEGQGLYVRRIDRPQVSESERVLLHFRGVATAARVSINGVQVGTHLGGWTPFRIDITEQVRGQDQFELRVHVDELTGHNSQGFLPVFAPHFGGIWQSVWLEVVPEAWIDENRILVWGDTGTNGIRLEVPVRGPAADQVAAVEASIRRMNSETWSAPVRIAVSATTLTDGTRQLKGHLPVPDWQPWSPRNPVIYEVRLRTITGLDGTSASAADSDERIVRAAFRDLKVEQDRIVLNGVTLVPRGLLNWGYAPPRVAPSIDEDWFRDEIQFARDHGFNMMKFCLWIPPKRYLELCDEAGLLTWMEYPTWHSRWNQDQLPQLDREFQEFFYFDRNHPSIILRSLTCETGPSADINVIRTLYDRCHAMVPQAIVEDDSSWIGWNRIHDFYDDHPYGNNDTWVETLGRLRNHIAERDLKPLVLGEAIAADTWTRTDEIAEHVGSSRPFWLPGFFDGNQHWIERMRNLYGESGVSTLHNDSLEYGLLMRKYQIEAFRREFPHGGYVVSVIRDIPLCGMGLIDYLGRSKWTDEQWNWHRDTMLLLATQADRRSFRSGELLAADLILSHFGFSDCSAGNVEVRITSSDVADLMNQTQVHRFKTVAAGQSQAIARIECPLPMVSRPTNIQLNVRLLGQPDVQNSWSLWVMPPDAATTEGQRVALHSTAPETVRKQLETAGMVIGDDSAVRPPIVTTQLDLALIDQMERSGRDVLLLATGETNSVPLSREWFLRGAPVLPAHPLYEQLPRQLLLELQHFDLSSPVVPDMSGLEEISPVLMLWNNHDIKSVKTQGLIYETCVGRGRLFVSAIRHSGATNSAGHWLLLKMLSYLADAPRPARRLKPESIAALREKVVEQRISLADRTWRFRPDPEKIGLESGWQLPSHRTSDSWSNIRIGSAWEGQGWAALDGWAWYQTTVGLPAVWQDRPVYISFEGVDDYYELYVNGQLAGTGGDIETRRTAFEDRTSHLVTGFVTAGQSVDIRIRVFDWYGAGGIFRPVSIGTSRIDGQKILK